MIPPIVRRCPRCGHLARAARFEFVTGATGRLVECPVCGHQYEPVENPMLE
jgi:transposase